MWWRTVLGYLAGAIVMAGIFLVQGTPLRELPVWVVGGGVLVFVVERVAGRRARTSRAVAVSAVALVGDTLAVQREGQPPRAYQLRDGRELTTAGLQVVERDRRHDVALASKAQYDDVARIWLDGEQRRALHGLQPQPAIPLEFVAGELVTTDFVLAEPAPAPATLPILVFHVATLDDAIAERLSLVALDGTVRWDIGFSTAMIRRAEQLFITADRFVFVLGRSPRIDGSGGRTIRPRGDEKPEAVVLDRATGAVTWRATV